MTTLQPRVPYSPEELVELYPKELELQLVQVLLRHGERAPVSARFQNAGLPSYWPYCHAAQRMRSVIMSPTDVSGWDSLQWKRRLEKFGSDDGPVIASGPGNEVDGICQLGELTDTGRETTYALGTRLRHLYVHQLQYMPRLISSADTIYLRATPLPRALESVQQAFWGMYPLTARTASFPPPTIVTRTPADETLYPNEGNCRRFAQLARAFAGRAGERWNDSEDMQFLNRKLGKWMPDSSPTVKVDSHPRLSGIMDTINSTLAHGEETRLPSEFYDKKVREVIDKIGVEEWFAGYMESREYRTLAIGGLVGDIVERMMIAVGEEAVPKSEKTVTVDTGDDEDESRGGDKKIRFAMSGCHDTTLGGILAALGAFEGEKWPPYTSHIAVELFKKKEVDTAGIQGVSAASNSNTDPRPQTPPTGKPGWLASMLGLSPSSSTTTSPNSSRSPSPSSTHSSTPSTTRQPYVALSSTQQSNLKNHYVRLRYNDRPMTIPACKPTGNHLEGDETFCTLETFKRVVDGFTPKNWKRECAARLGEEIHGLKNEIGDRGGQSAGKIEEGF